MHCRFATLVALTCLGTAAAARGAVLFADDFSGPFPGPWANKNASAPVGDRPDGWYHGAANTDLRAPGTGADAQNFASSNFETAGPGVGVVSSAWLISPALTLRNGVEISFDACATLSQDFPDRVQLRLNAHDGSTDTGATPTSVGSFDRLLVDINPTYAVSPAEGGFPTDWTHYSVTLTGLPEPTTGRFAFRYFVEDSGPDGTRGNEAGIDNVVVTPEPSSLAGLAASAGLLCRRRRRRARREGIA